MSKKIQNKKEIAMIDLTKKQIEIEKAQNEEAKNIYKKRLIEQEDKGNLDITAEGMILIKLGLDTVADKVREFLLDDSFSTNMRGKQNLINFLSNGDEYLISYIALKTLLRTSKSDKVSLVKTSEMISDALLDNNAYQSIKENDKKLFVTIERKFKKLKGVNKNKLLAKELDNKRMGIDKSSKIEIGSIIIDLVIKSGANIIEIEKQKNIRKTNTIRITDYAYSIIFEIAKNNLNRIDNNMLPMIVKPKPWTSFYNGGYLYNKLPIVKVRDSKIRNKYKSDFKKYLDKVNALNKLQEDAFVVNKKVLEVLNYIIDNKVYDKNSSKFFPRLVAGLPAIDLFKAEELVDGEEYKDINEYYKKLYEVKEDLEADRSRTLNLLKTVGIANDFKDYEELYFVYQFDTRYRKYTHQSFLTPQGKDYSKALLNKKEYVELDEVGIKWFKIHTANVFGKDKELLEDRIKWFDENIELIKNVAEMPIENMELWINVDSPFEFLSSCFAYMDLENTGKTNLPIQIDATCSGLQIFAGLMLDKKGAENVNVVNKYNENGVALRSDIYKIVSDEDNRMLLNGEYNKTITINKQEGEKETVDLTKIASEISGKIDRSIVKRNVMTLSYNATREGMKNQLKDVVKKMNTKNKKFWKEEDWKFVRLVLDLNEKSMDKNIKGARVGQKFLNELAVAKKDFLNYNTPLYSCPVYSTSFTYKEKRINTTIGKLTVLEKTNKVNTRKQKSSFAPNFIHSLDAELLDYVINESEFDISAIHDCFIINPNEAEKVRELFREGFIKMMEKQPLKLLEISNVETGITIELINDLNLEDVKKAEYILS